MDLETVQLNLTEIFQSIQGETTFAGLPTTFIRLASCNLRCVWCDTAYSFAKGDPLSLKKILHRVEENQHSHVCVTGGEPLLQDNVYPLMQILNDRNYKVSLETSGSLSIQKVDPRVHVILDIKCPASQMEHKNVWENMSLLKSKDEVKFVLKDRSDYEYAKQICTKFALYQKVRAVLFSLVHGELDPRELIAWILEDHLPVRLNLQLHKYIWSPNTRGV